MRIILQEKENKKIIIDKIKKENLIFYSNILNNKRIRATEETASGFFDSANKEIKFYDFKDFINMNLNKDISFYDLNFYNKTVRDKFYEDIYLGKTEIITNKDGSQRKYNNLLEIKEDKNLKNKQKFNSYLTNLNFIWKKDNKRYSVNLEIQQELINTINLYILNNKLKIKQPVLWHSYGEPYKEWQIEDLLLLYKDINKYIEQNKIKMKEYSDLIYKCQTVEEINAIDFIYE